MTADPFVTLLDIERNCKAYAVNIPRQIVTERDWLGIGFRSSDYNFVCTMEEVSEILRWPAMTDVPGSQPWFKGIANLRGHILPVTDLQGFISGTPHEETVLSRILVVNYENAYYGFAVGQVLGIERFFAEEVKPAVNLNNINNYMPYVKGVFERDYKPWAILNFGIIIQTAEFYHILTAKTEAA
jgi:twitching motility protein PilI